MQIKRQNLQKKSYQTVLFCNFQQLKPSYFAYLAVIVPLRLFLQETEHNRAPSLFLSGEHSAR
jgi:hypothetical protein